MKSLVNIITIIYISLLIGCAGSPAGISTASPEKLSKVSTWNLIKAWDHRRTKKIENEMRRRKWFSDSEWKLIKKRGAKVGMRRRALWVSWGPALDGKKMTDANGQHEVVYYRKHTVYLKNKRIQMIINE